MKHRFSFFAQLWKRVKDTLNEKPSKYAEVPPGCCALVFPDTETYNEMINGLADAKSWTGYNYPKVLDDTTLIIN